MSRAHCSQVLCKGAEIRPYHLGTSRYAVITCLHGDHHQSGNTGKKCLHEMVPSYLAQYCASTSSSWVSLNYVQDLFGKAPVMCARTLGTSGSKFWSTEFDRPLPVKFSAPELSIASFRKKLKTYTVMSLV